jgi:hypothetical protein
MKILLRLLPFLFVLTSNSYASSNERFHPSFSQYVSLGQIPGWADQRKFGDNPDIDTGTVPEDIWPLGGTYPFPTSALETTVSSNSANDTAGGSGCQKLNIFGLDSDYNEVIQIIDMNGTSNVTLETNLLRITSAFCYLSGVSQLNEGDISVKHGATVIGYVTKEVARTQQVIYTVPAGKRWLVDTAYTSILKQQSATAVVEYQIKLFGSNTWQTILRVGSVTQGTNQADASPRGARPFVVPEKTDIRLRVTSVSANDIEVNGNIAGFLVTGNSAL